MTLLLGVLAASLVGSVHCAAMCGGFVCLYAGLGQRATRQASAHVAYNGGRLISYVTLGLVAGAVGARLNRVADMARIERGAAIVAGSLMIIWAGVMVSTSIGLGRPATGVPDFVKRKLGALLMVFNDQPPSVRAGALGLLTTLLPCGWLYAFVVTAGGTGNPIAGGLTMFVFWLGTLPMMLGVGFGVQHIARPIARHLPLVGAIVVFALGALSITGKLRPLVVPGTESHDMHMHAAGAHVIH